MIRDYQAVTTEADLKSLLKEVQQSTLVAFDVETGYSTPEPVEKRALDMFHPDFFVVGFSITTDSSWARYVPLRHDSVQYFDPKMVWEMFRPVLQEQDVLAHHKKFEDKILRMLASQGDADSPIITRMGHDTMIAAHMTGAFSTTNLKHLSHEILGVEQATYASLFAEEDGTPAKPSVIKRSRFNHLDPTSPKIISYACDDAALCYGIFKEVYPLLTEDQRRVYGLEMAISSLLVQAESFGVGVAWEDMATAQRQGATFRPNYDRYVRERLGEMSGDPRIREKALTVNFGSSVQMRSLLYDDLGLSTTRVTKTGAMSTDAQALEGLSRRHLGIKGLLEYRETSNLANRIKKWTTEYSEAVDARAHATFAQTQVITGRFSANDPALQQLGKKWLWSTTRDENNKPVPEGTNGQEFWAGNFRDFVISGPGKYMLLFDYSQIELRVLAGVAKEPALQTAFNTGVDPHIATAAMMLGIPQSEVTDDQRSIGKTMNFAILYGMGPKSMAERLAITVDEARDLESQYKAQFSNISGWTDEQKRIGISQGFVTTWMGRTVPLRDAWSTNSGQVAAAERLAVNAPIQGGASDYVKLAMLRSQALLAQAGLWSYDKVMLTMNQHDSLSFEVDESLDPNMVRGILQNAVVFDAQAMFPDMQVPEFPEFEVDWELGLAWGSAKKWTDQQVVWDEQHSQWRMADSEPFRRPNAAPLDRSGEAEQLVLSLEPVTAPESPAQVEAVPEETQPAPTPSKTLKIDLPASVGMEEIQALNEMLSAHHGDTDLLIQVEGSEPVSIGSITSLTPADEGLMRVVHPGISLRWI